MKIIFAPRQSGKTSYGVSWVKEEAYRAMIVYSREMKNRLMKKYNLKENEVYTICEILEKKRGKEMRKFNIEFFVDDAEAFIKEALKNAGDVKAIAISNDDPNIESLVTFKIKNNY